MIISRILKIYLALSFVAVILTLVISLIFSTNNGTSTQLEMYLFAAVFISVSILGISLTIRPGWMQRFGGLHTDNLSKNKIDMKKRKRIGHHPDCDAFRSHTIKISNNTYCSGCLGLSIGLVTSIIIILTLSIIQLRFTTGLSISIIVLGIVIISLNFIEILMGSGSKIVHLSLSILLPISFLSISIGLFNISQDIIIGLVGILFSCLWMDTRVQLSFWRHEQTCKACKNKCIEFLQR